MITEKQQNPLDNNTDDDEENDNHTNLGMTTRSSSPTSHRSKTNSIISTASKANGRTRSASNGPKRKKPRFS